MIDFMGYPVSVGDYVYYITPRKWAHQPVRLAIGKVRKITKTGVMVEGQKMPRKCTMFVKVPQS